MGRTPIIGSKRQVWNRSRSKTKGGLTRKDLKKNKRGRIVSRRLSRKSKRENRLVKMGYKTRKGEFSLFSKR